MSASALTYSVKSAIRMHRAFRRQILETVSVTGFTSAMTARVALTDVAEADGIGHSAATLTIRPRAPGSATFTVTATDKGLRVQQPKYMLRR